MSSVAEVQTEQVKGSGRGNVSSGAELRRANKAQILRHLQDHGPSSRREIAARCGLAVSTLTSLIEELRTTGLVVELEPIRRPCAGRPTRPITLSSNDHCVLGLHLDDQAITAVATTLSGVETWSTEPAATITSPGTWADQIGRVLRDLRRICPTRRLLAVQVATSRHPEDPDDRAVLVQRLVRETIADVGVPVAVADELQMAGLQAVRGDLRLGPSRVGVYVGGLRTVGCSIVVGDRLLGRTDGTAHLPVSGHRQAAGCACGRSGCLSGNAGLTALLIRSGLLDPAGAWRSVRDDPVEAARTLHAQALAGNPQVMAMLNVAGLALRPVIDTVVGVSGAGAVAIGGYLGLLHPFLESSMRGQSTVSITALPTPEPLRIARGSAMTARLSVLANPS